MTPARYVRVPEVVQRSSLSRRTIYRRMEKGTFPKSVPLSDGVIAWPVEAFEQWLEAPGEWKKEA